MKKISLSLRESYKNYFGDSMESVRLQNGLNGKVEPYDLFLIALHLERLQQYLGRDGNKSQYIQDQILEIEDIKSIFLYKFM